MMLGLFVVTLLHAEGVGANGIVRRIPQPVGMLMDNFMARKKNHDVKDFSPPHSVRLTMVIG
jgi:hypothetical protein